MGGGPFSNPGHEIFADYAAFPRVSSFKIDQWPIFKPGPRDFRGLCSFSARVLFQNRSVAHFQTRATRFSRIMQLFRACPLSKSISGPFSNPGDEIFADYAAFPRVSSFKIDQWPIFKPGPRDFRGLCSFSARFLFQNRPMVQILT